mmetsp:Transcript_24378/g.37086  ORF Transcript_24378/g.37086 Transcript_24378/m.37086 type:complete len:89 (-) Transcript_24378:146-412(-)
MKAFSTHKAVNNKPKGACIVKVDRNLVFTVEEAREALQKAIDSGNNLSNYLSVLKRCYILQSSKKSWERGIISPLIWNSREGTFTPSQ